MYNWGNIQQKQKNIIISCIYRPPSAGLNVSRTWRKNVLYVE